MDTLETSRATSPDLRLEDLLQSLDGVVWEADARTLRIRFVSQPAERLFGYPVEAWLEDPTFWEAHLHPADRARVVEHYRNLAEALAGQACVYRLVASDGRPVWVRDQVTRVCREGFPEVLRGFMVDISREHETGAAPPQARWSRHLQQAPLAIVEWSLDGGVVSWNPAAERLFGYSEAEALGQPLQLLVLPADPTPGASATRLAGSLTPAPDASSVQCHNVRKDGTPLTCQWFNTPQVDVHQQVVGVTSMVLDVTDLHRVTQALEEGEARFRRLVELNPNAIVIQSEGQWQYANASALSLFRVPDLEAFQARTILDRIHPESHDAARRRMQRLLSGNQVPEQELSFLREDGSTFQAMVHGILFEHQGVPSILGVIRDITHEREMEAALNHARDNHQNLLMELPLLVWKGTPDGGCEFVNKAWRDFTGRDLEHLRGHQWAECVHPDDQAVLMKSYGQALATLQPMNMEFRMRTGDGEYRWVQGQGKPFYDPTGRFDGFQAVCVDIQDSREAEAALAAEEERFRTVADFTYDWEYWTAQDGTLLWMSPSCERVTGYPAEAFAQDPTLLMRLLHPEDQPLLARHRQEARAGSGAHSMDFRIVHRDGRLVWINHICTPVSDREGNPLGRRVSNRDITDRRQAEVELREASRQREAMLEAASVARVVPWSMGPQGQMHWGASADVVLGMDPSTLGSLPGWPWDSILAEDQPRLRQAIQQADSGLVASFECRMRHGLGHQIWTRWTLARENGQFHGAVQDVTEPHLIQEQLLQSQKLESVGTLVGGIAHDFNNLLGAILGYCELFDGDPDLNSRQRKGMAVIQGAAKRGRDLVGQLMGFSRKVSPNRVHANLNAVVSEAADLAARALPSGVRMELELYSGLPETLLDPGQLHQVVMNLVINARDALHGDGVITLRTGACEAQPKAEEPKGSQPRPHVFLEVEDTGCGIPPDQLRRIFEPFYTTKGNGGTGLGLSVVYGLVAEHGGFMECHSEVGRGTLFRVLLPLVPVTLSGPGSTPAG